MPMKHSPDVQRVVIEDLAFGGDGVGRIRGKTIFIPNTLPDEVVHCRIIETKKSFLRGELLKVLEASPNREIPVCPVFGRCGGCRYQHMTYPAELRTKENQIREILRRIGGVDQPPVAPIVPSPEPYGYRSRIQIHWREGLPGFQARHGSAHVAIKSCPLAAPELNEILTRQTANPPQENGRKELRLDGQDAAGFAQINRFLRPKLRDLVVHCLPGGPGHHLLECYAGAGFFTAEAARKFDKITAIEWDSRLVEAGRETTPGHVTWWNQEVELGIHRFHWPDNAPVTILTDPPREGIPHSVLEVLSPSPAKHWVYLSCNPTTLARDLKTIAPYWQPVTFIPVDLFPRTAHIEVLAVLRKREP